MPVPKMCQTCWITPATKRVRGADGRRRWKCQSCLDKRNPQRAATQREMLERRIFNKDTI